jgi:hypothetical protein
MFINHVLLGRIERDRQIYAAEILRTKTTPTHFHHCLTTHPNQTSKILNHLKMANTNGSAIKEDVTATSTAFEGKGKGKAPAEPQTHDEGMDIDESSSEEEVDEVSFATDFRKLQS